MSDTNGWLGKSVRTNITKPYEPAPRIYTEAEVARVRAEAKRAGMEGAARIAERVRRDFAEIKNAGALGAALTRDEIRAAAALRARAQEAGDE
jgi:hypothetical protein